MIGPLVNAAAIILCAFAGRHLIRGLSARYEELIKKALGLAVLYIGIDGALQNESVMILIFSLVLGSVLGEWIDIDKRMNALGQFAERKIGAGDGTFAKGFVTASILFCTGSMAIVGSLESGLKGDHEMLFSKAILDGVISIVFASEMGIGVAFSAVPVLLYEGLITLGAYYARDLLTPQIITEMSAVGSLLVAAIGLNFLMPQQIKVANMIPAVFLPWVFLAAGGLFLH